MAEQRHGMRREENDTICVFWGKNAIDAKADVLQ